MADAASAGEWSNAFEAAFSAQKQSAVVLPRYRVAGERVKVLAKNGNQTATAVAVSGGGWVEKFEPNPWRGRADGVTIRDGVVELVGAPELVSAGVLTAGTGERTRITITGEGAVRVDGDSTRTVLSQSKARPATRQKVGKPVRTVTPKPEGPTVVPAVKQAEEKKPEVVSSVPAPAAPKPKPPVQAVPQSVPAPKPKPKPVEPVPLTELPEMRVPEE